MGKFTKSIFILLVAISTPLVYRQFATDKTITFMSSYYSNYKMIDQFLRQSAGHLDSAKQYLPDSQQVKGALNQLNEKFNSIVKSTEKSGNEGAKGETDKKSTNSEQAEVKYRQTKCPGDDVQTRLWSKYELAQFDGNTKGTSEIYLGFLGLVYNVTIGHQHYGPGAEYNVFAGRDATRAFVTGNFTHDLHDDISDIDKAMYSHIESWASFYGSNYPVIGRIEGQFFDSRGCGTQKLGHVYKMFEELAQERTEQQEQDQSLPDCNSEWNSDLKKGRVWCSNKSGGIERDWAGVPRLFNGGETKRCVCLNLADSELVAHLEKTLESYPGCGKTSTECSLDNMS